MNKTVIANVPADKQCKQDRHFDDALRSLAQRRNPLTKISCENGEEISHCVRNDMRTEIISLPRGSQ